MLVITLARKPLSSSVARSVSSIGTGGLNIDATRIGFAGEDDKWKGSTSQLPIYKGYMDGSGEKYQGAHHKPTLLDTKPHDGGRWPANVIFEHRPGCACTGTKKVKGSPPVTGQEPSASTQRAYGTYNQRASSKYVDDEGLETVADWVCEPDCPVAELNFQSGESKGGSPIKNRPTKWMQEGQAFGMRNFEGYPDSGGASRFFKTVGGKR